MRSPTPLLLLSCLCIAATGLWTDCAMAQDAASTSTAPMAAVPAASTALPQVLELGAIQVSGERVRAALRAIKQALKAPDSTDAAHRDDLVCRFVHEIANLQTYLDCAINATNIQRRNATQTARLAPHCESRRCDSPADMKNMLSSLVANQPGERLHILVNPYQFKKMMAVAAVPAAVTAHAPVKP